MSRKLVNIGGDENDINYRYKMPVLQTKIEGRGNGIKTVVTNIIEVCKPLRTQPDWVTKYFGMEKGALSQFNPERMVGIVNGAHQASDFQKVLKIYINDFILCPQCKLPELQTKVNTSKGVLLHKCMSCNWKGRNTSTHKVKTYMINHPPEKEKDKANKSEGKDKIKIKKTQTVTINENDLSWQTDPQDEALAERTQVQLELLAKMKLKPIRDVQNKPEKNVNNATSAMEEQISPTAANTEETPLSPIASNKYTSDASMDAALEGPVDVLRVFFNESNHSLDEQLDEIHRLKLAYGLDDEHKYKVLLDATLNCHDQNTLVQSLKQHKLLLQQLTLEPSNTEQFFSSVRSYISTSQSG